MATEQNPTTFTVNGRTLSLGNDFNREILGDYTDLVTINVVESGRVFIECESVSDAQVLFETFKDNDLKPRVVSYSLFFRSKDELTLTDAQTIFSGMTDAQIMYVRVDPNGHTGKLVVDTLSEYQALKSHDDETIQFYHFDGRAKTKNRRRESDTRQ